MHQQLLENARDLLPNIPLELVTQGAEALVFSTPTHPYLSDAGPCIVKYRPPKHYRHPKLDLAITKSRTSGEARLLGRLYELDIRGPELIAIDAVNGIIWMTFVGFTLANGKTSSLKNWLWNLESESRSNDAQQVCRDLGSQIAKLHKNDIIHGDLTSSNIILQSDSPPDESTFTPMFIDFGLSSISTLVEDKAVDLYLLERALTSTHPASAHLYFEWIFQTYEQAFKDKKEKRQFQDIHKRLKDVRLRGRKRSMLG